MLKGGKRTGGVEDSGQGNCAEKKETTKELEGDPSAITLLVIVSPLDCSCLSIVREAL